MYLKYRKLTINRVVTINISVRRRRFQDMLHKVKRPVSLLLGELVCYVVLKRSRTKWLDLREFSCIGHTWQSYIVFSDGADRE